MSKKAGATKARDRAASRKARPADAAAPAPARAEPVELLPPFQPRRRLFYGLLTAFALWVGLLLGLYAFTVYPTNGERPQPTENAAGRETVSG